ncbi:MAG: pectate lyase [Deltaproteobacteria bacterium]|nr:pectate lyase [Deltaproteobacteria bacterium]
MAVGFSRFAATFLIAALAVSATSAPVNAQVPVFPGAEGYGSDTVAGSGRHLSTPRTTVYKVVNLNNSGSGSLRECVDAVVPRVCVFEVSGQIKLTQDLSIRSPYITIAGQTAPSPGILLTGASLRIESHNVLVQHMEVRPGDGAGTKAESRDGLTVGTSSSSRRAYKVFLDHLSISWGIDENASTYHSSTHEVTFSKSIVSESLHDSLHPEGPHGSGMLIGDFTTRISVHNSLFAHNNDRNIRLKAGATIDFINNVIYNWGGTSGSNLMNMSDDTNVGAPILLNMVGNVYKRGPNSPFHAPLYGRNLESGSRAYVSNNIGPTRPTNSGSEWLISSMPQSPYQASSPPLNMTTAARSPSDTFQFVLANAGSRPADRNDVDARVISEVANGTGTLKDCVSGCSRHAGGWPARAQNYRALSVPDNFNSDPDGNGYTILEEWLHSMAAEVEGRRAAPGGPTPAQPPDATKPPSSPKPPAATPGSPNTPTAQPNKPSDGKKKKQKGKGKKSKKKNKQKQHRAGGGKGCPASAPSGSCAALKRLELVKSRVVCRDDKSRSCKKARRVLASLNIRGKALRRLIRARENKLERLRLKRQRKSKT